MKLNKIYKIYFEGGFSSFYIYKLVIENNKTVKKLIHCFPLLEDISKERKIIKKEEAILSEFYKKQEEYFKTASRNKLNTIKEYGTGLSFEKAFQDWLNNENTIRWLDSRKTDCSDINFKLILAGCWQDAWNEANNFKVQKSKDRRKTRCI